MTEVRIPAAALDVVRRHFAPPPKLTLAQWCAERTGEHLWSKQIEIAEALEVHRMVAVKAGHGVGKSWSAARIAAKWIDDHPPGDAFVVTSAPSWKQVQAVLWRELRTAHRAAGLAGSINLNCEWTLDGNLVALGRKPADHDEHGFQGIHARRVLVVLDEACGIPGTLWTAALTLLTNADARIIAIGNPDSPAAEFAKVCAGAPVDGTSGMSDQGWHVITVSVLDSPNFTGEPVPDRLSEMLPSDVWLAGVSARWGTDSPLYTSKVLGQFPSDATDGVIPNSWAQTCRPLDYSGDGGPIELGVDPAGEGADHAVCWARRGRHAWRRWVWPSTPDPHHLAELILAVIHETGASAVKIDADGLGWGVSGILDEMHRTGRHNAVAIPVRGSATATDERQFLNLRAEVWWQARERSRTEGWDLSALDDDDLAELVAPRYHTSNPRSRIQIEHKAEIRKRLGRSPDSAEALLLAFHEVHHQAVSFAGAVAAVRI